jgi:hypothetical protein
VSASARGAQLDGLTWHSNGQSVLSGRLLDLFERIDRSLAGLAWAWGAEEYRFPTFVSARELQRLDYFRSFPHLVTFPVCLDGDEGNLRSFADGSPVDGEDHVQLTRPSPIADVLTPAACYHVFIHLQGTTADEPRYLTTRNTCFRREAYFSPLERQWSFSMREVVAIGSLEEVRWFLASCQSLLDRMLEALGLPVEWQVATDPFFRPSSSGKHLAQLVNPTKKEAVFDGRLAIASLNLHQDHFGRIFAIRRGGADAYSGCVAFGLERWLYAFTTCFGPDPAGWPSLESFDAELRGHGR